MTDLSAFAINNSVFIQNLPFENLEYPIWLEKVPHFKTFYPDFQYPLCLEFFLILHLKQFPNINCIHIEIGNLIEILEYSTLGLVILIWGIWSFHYFNILLLSSPSVHKCYLEIWYSGFLRIALNCYQDPTDRLSAFSERKISPTITPVSKSKISTYIPTVKTNNHSKPTDHKSKTALSGFYKLLNVRQVLQA